MKELPEGFMEWLESEWLVAFTNLRPEEVCSELGMSLEDAIIEYQTGKRPDGKEK